MPTKLELQQENDSLRARVLEMEATLSKDRAGVKNAGTGSPAAIEEELMSLLAAQERGFYVMSARGETRSINGEARRILGKYLPMLSDSKTAPAGWELIDSDGRHLALSGLPSHRALRTGKVISDAVVGIRRTGHGVTKWLKATSIPRFKPGGKKPYEAFTVLLDITDARGVEHRLGERIKELNAFYMVGKIVESGETDLGVILQQVAGMLPESWQYPDIAGCCITYKSREYKTDNFMPSRWVQSAPIINNGQPAGTVEICYLARRPKQDEGPFLKEERLLLDAVAERLSRVSERLAALEALSDRTKYLQMAIDATGLGTWRQDAPYYHFIMDETSRGHFGFDRADVPAMEVYYRVHPDDVEPVMQALQQATERGDSRPLHLEYRVVRPDGSARWLAAECTTEYANREGRFTPVHTVGTTMDITVRKQAEQDRARHLEQLQSLVNVLEHEDASQQDFLDYALEEAIKLTDSKIGYIYYYDEEKREFTLNTWSKEVMQECTIAEKKTLYHLEKTGIWGEAVRQRKPIVVNDFQTPHPLKKGYPEGHATLHRYLTVPVFVENSIVAVVGVANKETDYTQRDVLQLTLLMDSAWRATSRRQMADELRKANENYSLISENVEDVIWVLDVESREPTYVSPSVINMLGYKPEDFLGRRIGSLMTPGSAQQLAQLLEGNISDFLAGRIPSLPPSELDMYHSDGHIVRTEVLARPTHTPEGKLTIIGISRDITQKKKMEEELRTTQVSLENAQALAHMGSWELDTGTGKATWSKGMFLLFNFDPARGTPPLEEFRRKVQPDDWAKLLEQQADVLATGDSQVQAYRAYPTPGDERWFETTIHASSDREVTARHLTGTVQDITERVLAEKELKEANERYELIAEHTTDTVWLMDMELRTIYHSPSVARVRGFTPEEVIRMTVEQSLAPESFNRAMALLAEELPRYEADPGYNEVAMVELEFTHKGGSTIWAECKFSVLRDEEGRPQAILGEARDITDRRKAQQLLMEEEARSKQFLDTVETIFVSLDAEGKIMTINRKGCQLLGYKEAELLGQRWFSRCLPQPDGMENVYPYFLTLMAGKLESAEYFENAVITSSGETRQIAWHNALIRDSQGRVSGTVSSGEDITERIKADATIRETRDSLQLLLDSTAEGIYGIDLQGNCTLCNAACLRILGYAPSTDMAGRNMHDLVHHHRPDGSPYPVADCPIYNAFRHGRNAHVEDEVFWREDGTSFPVEYFSYPQVRDGKVVGAVVAFVDITERKNAQLQLEKANERYRFIAENTADMIWVLDVETNRFEFISPSVNKMRGYSAEELEGVDLANFVDPGSLATLQGLKAEYVPLVGADNVVEIPTFEINNTAKDGRAVWTEVTARALRNATGKVQVIGVSRDITARRKTEEELRKSQSELAEAQHISHIGSWSLDVATGVVRWSEELYSIFDVDKEAFGNTYDDFISRVHPDDRDLVLKTNAAARSTGESFSIEYRLAARDGRPKHIHEIGYAARDSSGNIARLYGTAQDITERREVEKQVQRDLDVMRRLRSLSVMAVRAEDLEPILAEIVDIAMLISGADRGNIQLLDPDSGDLRIAAQHGFPEWWLHFWNSVTRGRGSCGTALERGERVIVEDVEESPIFQGTPALDIQRRAEVRAVQSTPLVSLSGKPVGMFSTHYRTPGAPDEHTLRLLDLLARQAADIIEYLQTTAALRKSQEELERYFTSSLDMLCIADMQGRFIRLNPEWEKVLGYPVGELLGKDFRDFIHPDDLEATAAVISNLAGGEELLNFENRYRCRDGSYRWLEWRSKPQGGLIYAVARDITDNKRAREEAERLAALVRHTAEMIAMAEPESGEVIFLNDAGANILGVKPSDLAGHNLMEFVPEHWKDKVANEAVPSQRSGRGWEGDMQILNIQTGKLTDVHSLLFTIDDEATGKPLYLANVSMDITERKRMEQELRSNYEMTQAIFNSIQESIFLIGVDGTVLRANETGAGRLGVRPEDFIGKRIFDIMPLQVAEARKNRMDDVIKTRAGLSFEDERAGRFFLNSMFPVVEPGSRDIRQIAVYSADITKRKRSEEALKTSYEMTNAVFNATLESVLLIDTLGTIIQVNETGARRLGSTPEHMSGKCLWDLLPPENTAFQKGKLAEMISSRTTQSFEDVIESRRFQINAYPIPDANGAVKHTAIYARDVTDENRFREALKFEQERNTALITNAPDGIVVLSVSALGSEGRLTYASPSALNMFGFSEDDLGKWDPIEFTHADDLPQVLQAFGAVFGDPSQAPKVQYRFKTKAGKWRWIESTFKNRTDDPHIRGIIINFRDITDSKEAEAKLVTSEATQRSLLEAIPESVLLAKPDGTGLLANSTALQRSGTTLDKFAGSDLFDWVPPEAREDRRMQFKKAVQTGQMVRSEYLHGERWMLTSINPIVDERGSVIRVAITNTDISNIKKMEEDIRRSEERYRLLYENMAQGVIGQQADGEVAFMNPACEEILGLTLEQLKNPETIDTNLDATLEDGTVYPADEHPTMQALKTGKPVKDKVLRIYNPRKQAWRWVSASAVPQFRQGEAQPFMAFTTFSDITEGKLAEIGLAASEEKYRLLSEQLEQKVKERTAEVQDLYDNAPIGYHSLGPGSSIVMMNKTELGWLGYSWEEVSGRKYPEFLTPASREIFKENFPRFMQSGRLTDLELELVRRDGTIMPIIANATAFYDEAGNYHHSRSTIFDNTQRKAAEDEVRRVNQLSDTALELARAGYWYLPLDGSGQAIASDRVTEIQGDPPHADHRYLLKEEWQDNILEIEGKLPATMDKPAAEAIMESQGYMDYVFRYRRPADRQAVWLHMRGNADRDSQGNITGITGVTQDITAQKQMELDLQKARKEADEANRAKSVFLANMSHEIRTPLNAILGFTQVMLKDRALDDRNRSHLQTISRSGEHLLNLINEILEMSKIEAGHVSYKPSAFNLASMLKDMHSMFDPRLQAKGLSMALEPDPGLPEHIVSDESKVREILINLLGNAVKFTEKGGITLRCRAEKDPGSDDPAGLLLVMELEDTGVGIQPEELPKIFQAFEQTRSGAGKIGGTGLGLAISQSHARLMGGEITATSTPGIGSCFRVRLPVLAAAESRVHEATPARVITGLKPGTGEVRVLIADDHEENRMVLEELLRPLGLSCRGARDGREAAAMAAEWRPRLVLMDLRMPGMDGYEASKLIKATESGKDMQIIAVTASALDTNMEKITGCGMTGYLRKPYKESELHQALAEKLGDIFTFSSETPVAGPPGPKAAGKVTVGDIAAIPRELRRQVAAAAGTAHFDRLMDLADRLQAASPQAAEGLRELTNEFRYDAILELFGKEEGNGN